MKNKMGVAVIKFEEEFFQDVCNLFKFFNVPENAYLRVRSQLKIIYNPITNKKHKRPVISIQFESELGDDDFVHIIELVSGDKIKVAITEQDMKQFANKEDSYKFVQDAASLGIVREAIIARKNSGAW